jgi:secreted PhoX family phosphatase
MALETGNTRRRFLTQALIGAGMLSVGGGVLAGINEGNRGLLRAGGADQRKRFVDALRAGLEPPDANGVRLPPGFSSRIVARTGQPAAAGGTYNWHGAPDGGATYPTPDGGWVYACNAELAPPSGGVGVLKFDAQGNVVDSYRILDGTNRNCAGGPTPWNTWLSCEEYGQGLVWECDPYTAGQGVARPALGTFSHEAVAVDPVGRALYLTEDTGDSGFYRFRPTNWPSLEAGVLEIATVTGDATTGRADVTWTAVPNPNPTAAQTPTRNQVTGIARFNRGEGIYFHNGVVYFTTTGDHRVWAYRTSDAKISVIYDGNSPAGGILREPDNVVVDARGYVYVAEDSDDLQIVMLTPEAEPIAFVQLVGHDASEITGPAFSPDGKRFYFNSQRGTSGSSSGGMTVEITGPFPSLDLVFADGYENRIELP